MDGYIDPMDHPKSKRRRLEADISPTIYLTVDDRLRGDVAELSTSNFDTFTDQSLRYVAIAPRTILLGQDVWTVVPVTLRRQAPEEPYPSIYFSSNSLSLKSFQNNLEGAGRSGTALSAHKSIEVRIQDIVPLYLDTVYIAVEKNLLENIDETQDRFGGGHNAYRSGRSNFWSKEEEQAVRPPGKGHATKLHDRLVIAMRETIQKLNIIHTGDLLPLPLPSHPITHVPSPPALVTACEPVDQGRLSPQTKIILVQARSSQDRIARKAQPSQPLMNDVLEDTEDTSNEQFYSAVEDKGDESPSEFDSRTGEDSSEISHSSSDSGEVSDDSLEDMISLAAPGLPQQPSGTMSAASVATPRPGLRKGTGAHTPGSMFSSFTNATSRPGRAGGKIFKSSKLSRRVPANLLYPKPREEDDDDAFIFIDTSILSRLGCFSGDWVRVESSAEPSFQGFPSLSAAGMNGEFTESTDWRPARVFGLTGIGVMRPRYAVDKSGDRRSSFSHGLQPPLTPNVYLSPLFLLNMRDPKFVKISPLKHNQLSNARTSSESTRFISPPPAEQISLLKLRTPLSLERTTDSITFPGLKQYFESKCRILKRGDLIGVSINKEIAKATYTPTKSVEEGGEGEMGFSLSQAASNDADTTGIVWFYVSQISATQSLDAVDDRDDEETWNGALVNYSSTTRMSANIAELGEKTRESPSHVDTHIKYWFESGSGQDRDQPRLPPLSSHSFEPYESRLQERLCDLLVAAVSPRATTFQLPALFILLHSTQRQIGKTYIAKAGCVGANVEPFLIDCFDIVSEGLEGNSGEYRVEETLLQRADRVLSCGAGSTAIVLQHIEMLTADRISSALEEILSKSRVIIATSADPEKMPDSIRGLFTHEFELRAPDEAEREGILRNAVRNQDLQVDGSVDLSSVALKTAALVAGDLVDVVSRASHARLIRLQQLANIQTSLLAPDEDQTPITVHDIILSGGPTAQSILHTDFDAAINHARTAFSTSIGAPKIPSVTWDDVGGLSSVKHSVMETISLPLERPELFAQGMRKRSGILFYGPPGTGKTLLAKAIATEYNLNFFSVKGPELLNMYIGESEANVRRVFQRARDARPCVVFFDELDSVAPKRGNQGDSGGVMDRIVSQLLAELDGMSSGTSSSSSADNDDGKASANAGGVFVIGATNRPDLLDPALLRPGRFDKMVYLGVPDAHEKQIPILEALTRKFALSPAVNLAQVASTLPLTYTGADLYALCSDAMLKAVMRKAGSVDQKIERLQHDRGGEKISTAYFFDRLATEEDLKVVVAEEDFEKAREELVGSVSAQELAHFERIRRQFEEQDSLARNTSHQSAPAQNHRPNVTTNASHPVQNVAFRPKPPPPKRSDTVVPMNPTPNAVKSKGKAKASVIANPDSGPEDGDQADADVGDEEEDSSEEDEYVIRTGALNGRGRGRNKGNLPGVKDFGEVEDDEEGDQMYT